MINLNRVQINKKFLLNNDYVDFELLVDGFIINDVKVGENYKETLGLPNYYIIAKGKDSLQTISRLTLNELRTARLESVKLTNWTRWESFNISITFGRDILTRRDIMFEVSFDPDLTNWKLPYSYNDYFKTFCNIWNEVYESEFHETLLVGENDDKFKPVLKAILNDLFLADETENNLVPFFKVHQKTLSELKDKHFEDSLLTTFNFPDELKVSCKQYLLYFAQFLQDLGINATSDLKEEAGKVLFSITPTGENQALSKIREALAVYLNLPASPIEFSDSFEAMRLEQQIESLQYSQRMKIREIRTSERELRLALTTIEHQDKTILQKDSVIDQKDKIIEKLSSKSIMTDSLENKEKLYEGLEFVPSEALKKYLGVIFQPVTFFKQLGTNFLGKDNEMISILNCEENLENTEKQSSE